MAFAPLIFGGLSASGAMAGMAAIGALGSIYSGMQQNAQYKAAAANADANARNVALQSNANEETRRRENRMRMGNIRASAGQSGFDANTGSLADLQVKSAAEMELDVLTDRYNGDLQSISLRNEANSLRAQGKAARTSGFLSAAGTLFQGAAGYGSASKIPFYGVGGSPY